MLTPPFEEKGIFRFKPESQDFSAVSVPDIEQMAILAVIHKNPGLDKRKFITELIKEINNLDGQILLVAKYIDILVDLKYLFKCSFVYHITPLGLQHLRLMQKKYSDLFRKLIFTQF